MNKLVFVVSGIMSPQRRSGLLRWLSGKESVCQCRRCKRLGFDPWVWKIPWRRKWQPTPSSLPGKSHGQKNLVDYSIRGRKESSWLSIHTAEMFKTCEYVTIYGKGDFGNMIKGKYFEVGDCCFCCSVTKSCLTLCDSMNCSTPGFPVLHYLLEFAQIHEHWVNDAIQPFHPLSPSSPLALSLSQQQGLFQWVSSLHQVAKILELQHQSLQWIFRTDFL